jgi:hypothetical protein
MTVREGVGPVAPLAATGQVRLLSGACWEAAMYVPAR